jgi:CysZ protein
MKSINFHAQAAIVTVKTLFKGRFLVFFIPGLVIMLAYIYLTTWGDGYKNLTEKAEDVSYIGGALGWILGGIGDLFSKIFNELYKFLILVLLAPVMTILSENYDAYLTGQKYSFNLIKVINDLVRMIFVVFLALILEFTAYILFYLIISIFVPKFLEPSCYFLITAFFVGFSFYDYSLERYSISTFGSLGFAFKKPLTMVLTGSVFTLIYMIPYVGIPIAPVLTVVYLKIKGIQVHDDGFKEPKIPVEEQKTIES